MADWILAMESYGLDPDEIAKVSGQEAPADLWLKFDEHRIRSAKRLVVAEIDVSGVAPTEELFNQPQFERTYELPATVTAVFDGRSFACDRSILYPTGGGQAHDDGLIVADGLTIPLADITKVCNVVIFTAAVDLPGGLAGKTVVQRVDAETRELLRVQHTATHVIAAAARRVLGPHVWQNGAKKTKEGAHIDLTHYENPSADTVMRIDAEANLILQRGAAVRKRVYSRKEAEGRWGFVLYQGGAIPGNSIRVVDIDGIDTEACCGTHCDSLAEIGQIKIVRSSNVCDGVFRIEFVAGKLALKSHHEDMNLIQQLMDLYGCQREEIEKNAKRFFQERAKFETAAEKWANTALDLQVELGIAKNLPRFLIRRPETEATMFLKGIDAVIAKKPEAKGKAIFVVGATYFFGLVPTENVEEVKAAFQPVVAQAKIKLNVYEEKGKARPHGHVGLGCMRFGAEVKDQINQVFAGIGFVE